MCRFSVVLNLKIEITVCIMCMYICRTKSQENMSKRMEEALTLMEDILSAEPPSHHLTTHHLSATSRTSCSGKSFGSLTRQTNASIPTTHTAKPIGVYALTHTLFLLFTGVCCCRILSEAVQNDVLVQFRRSHSTRTPQDGRHHG